MANKNILTGIMNKYTGVWYMALFSVFVIAVGGMATSSFVFGSKITLELFLGNCLFGFGLMFLGLFLKRKYKN